MIKILPITDENELKKYCDEHGLEDDSAVMVAADGDEYLGSVSAVIRDGEFYITSLESPYDWMLDGLIKSILAYGDNRFMTTAKTELFENKTAFQKVGFKENDGVLEIEISKVIHNCKG